MVVRNEERAKKRNHPFRKAPAVCKVEVSKAKLSYLASETVPKQLWEAGGKKKLPEQPKKPTWQETLDRRAEGDVNG